MNDEPDGLFSGLSARAKERWASFVWDLAVAYGRIYVNVTGLRPPDGGLNGYAFRLRYGAPPR
jgi:hypothetical protein